MTEKEFLDRFHTEISLYENYGKYIKETILHEVSDAGLPDHWFVIEPSYRVKDEKSLLAKAFYRNKNYSDPYNDITDKVGLRFVLLTTDQVTELTELIENISIFNFRKDRDYLREQNQNPTTFIYQSMHYIISLKKEIEYCEYIFKNNIFCEVQIRTLLQHAYSELTHDTIYKPKTIAEPKTHRLVARSMALIETTDAIFSDVSKQVCIVKSKNDIVLNSLKTEYSNRINFEQEDRICNILLDYYDEYIPTFNEVYEFISKKTFIIDRINDRALEKLLYRQPVILILYYLVYKIQNIVLKLWPFTQEELEPIYTDLGFCLPSL